MVKLLEKIRLKKLGIILYDVYKEPSNYQIMEIALSVVYLFLHSVAFKFCIMLSILGIDVSGRLVQYKFNGKSKDYEKNDLAVDRITELFIFSGELSNPIGKLFFFMAILNTVLSYYKVETGRRLTVDLKLLYLLPLGYRLLFL